MIKRVRFKWNYAVSDISWARMQFVTKINGKWAIFSPGAVLGYDKNHAEFENLTVTSNGNWNSSSSNNLSVPFCWYTNYVSSYDKSLGNGGYFDITFKEGIQVLQGFYHCFIGSAPDILEIYDENDVLIYNNNKLKLETCYSTSSYSVQSTNYFYATPELELMKTYPINKLGTLETNDISHVSNAYSIDQILPEYAEPDGTKIRFALSFDGRNTYKVCNHGTWTEIDKDKIIEDGMTGTELSGLISSNYVLALTENKTVDILVGMITENPNSTPNIIKITTDYLEIV